MAAEFIACYEASNHGIWLWNFVMRLRIVGGVDGPLRLFCVNKSAVLYSNNSKSSTKSKYIDIKFLIVKERVHSGQLSIEHVGMTIFGLKLNSIQETQFKTKYYCNMFH